MDLYTGELQDLWSANDQMSRVLKKRLSKVSDPSLKEMLAKSQEGISAHTELLKQLLAASDDKVKKEHCKGMEGLVAEAIKHTTEKGSAKRSCARCNDHRTVPAHVALRHRWFRHRSFIRRNAQAQRRSEAAEASHQGNLWR